MIDDGEKKFDKDILPTERARKSYSQEENYRAYKLFCMMDVDGGGSISLREINRVLMGETVRYVTVTFDHPDTGILFGLDEEKYVYIAEFERESVASQHPTLVRHMRLFRMNNYKLKPKVPKELHRVHQELLRLGDEKVELEFYEPAIIINKFSCFLDIEIDSQVFACQFPLGAYYDAATFEETLMTTMMQTSSILQFINVSLNVKNRQVTFTSSQFRFRLLFATGRNFRLSCRYALGFTGEDTPYGMTQIGQPMLMNLHLGITQDKMEVLMLELFNQFDTDGSGEFEFEEFRDFYIKYLDDEESQQRLRDYAHYRFRDIERERFVQAEIEGRRHRAKRKSEMRVENASIIAKQRQDFFDNSYVDEKGMRRRKYRHPSSRPNSQQSPSRPTSAANVSLEESPPQSPDRSINEVEREGQVSEGEDMVDKIIPNARNDQSEEEDIKIDHDNDNKQQAIVPPSLKNNDGIIKPSDLLRQNDSLAESSDATLSEPSQQTKEEEHVVPTVLMELPSASSPSHRRAFVLPPALSNAQSQAATAADQDKEDLDDEEEEEEEEEDVGFDQSIQPSLASSQPVKYFTTQSSYVSSGSDETPPQHHKPHRDDSKHSTAPTEATVASANSVIITAEHVAVPHKLRAKKARMAKKLETKAISMDEEEQKLLRKMKREEILAQKRLAQKERQQKQLTKRQQMFRKLLEANKSLLQQQKSAKLIDISGTSGEGRLTIEMMALYYQVKKAIIASMKLSIHDEYSHFAQYNVDVKQMIASPAVTVLPGILSNASAAKGFEFATVSAQKMHPSVLDYYLLKENHANIKEICNQEYLHPVYFFADYMRHPTRNSHHALGMIKFMKHERDIGVHYRAQHHLPHFKGVEAPIPLEEMLPNQKKKYLENLGGKKTVTFQLQQQEEAANHEGIVGRMTIQSIVLENLPSIHVFEKNSPFVTIQCGYQGYLNDSKNANGKNIYHRVPEYRYAFSTEAFSYAGSYCAWEDLDYVIKLRRTDELIISAYSGSQQYGIKFGSFLYKAAEIAAQKANQDHVIELVGELIDDEYEKALEAWKQPKQATEGFDQPQLSNKNDIPHMSKKEDGSVGESVPETDLNDVDPSSSTNLTTLLNNTLQNTLPLLKSSLKSGGQFLKTTTTKLLSNANHTISTAAKDLVATSNDTNRRKPRKMGTFRMRIYIEQGSEWDWFIQAYNQHQRRIHQIKDQIQLYSEIAAKMNRTKAKSISSSRQLGSESIGLAEEASVWSNSLDARLPNQIKDNSTAVQYILQINSISIFDMLPTNPWLGIFTGKHEWYLLLDTGNVELTTIDQAGIDSDQNTGKEWSYLQWELPLSTYYQKNLIFRIYSHRTLIGKYVLPVDYVLQRIDTTAGQHRKGAMKFKAQELEFFGEIFNNKQELCGKLLIKSVAIAAPPEYSSSMATSPRVSFDKDSSLSRSQSSLTERTSNETIAPSKKKEKKRKKSASFDDEFSTKVRKLGEILPWAKANEDMISAPVITDHVTSLLTEESITLFVSDILIMDIASSAIHTNIMSSLFRNLRTLSLQTVIHYHSEAFTTPPQPPLNAATFPWNVQFTKVNHSFLLMSDLTHNLRMYVKYGDNIIGECVLANSALVETRADPTGKRELLAILTAPGNGVTTNKLQPFTASSTNMQSNAHGAVTAKLRLSYYLFSTPQAKAPMSAIPTQLTLHQTLCYPLLITLIDVSVFHLRSVHSFHKNSPAVKFLNPIPLQPMQEQAHITKVITLTTPTIKHAGSYAKWTNLYWEFVIDREDDVPLYTMQFIVMSEALVVGTGYITFQQVVSSAPDRLGIADIIIPLYSDPSVAKRALLERLQNKHASTSSVGEVMDASIAGELKLSFTLEPHVENKSLDENSLMDATQPEHTVGGFGSSNTHSLLSSSNMDQTTSSMPFQRFQLDDFHIVLNRTLRGDLLTKFQTPHRVYAQILCGEYHANLLLNETPSRYVLQYNNLHALFVVPVNQMLVYRLYTENVQLEEVLLGECMCTIEEIIANGREDMDGFVHYDVDIFLEHLLIGAMVMKLRLLPSNDSLNNVPNKQEKDKEEEDYHSLWLQSTSLASVQHDWNEIAQPFWIRIEKVIITELLEIRNFLRKQRKHRLENAKSSKCSNKSKLLNPEDVLENEEEEEEEQEEDLFPFFLQLAYDQPNQCYTIPSTSYSFASEDHHSIVFDSMDWVFVVSQPTESWSISCFHGNELLGTMTLQVSDWQYAHPKGHSQQYELIGTMILTTTDSQDKPVVAGKMTVNFQTKRLFPQIDSSAPTTLNELRKKQTLKKMKNVDDITEVKAVGNLYIQSIEVSDLYQVYSLFPNSPRILFTMGKYSFSTTVALDAGKEYTWEDLQWGRLSIYARDQVTMEVLSNHEVIGYCAINYKEMYDYFSPKIDPLTGQKEENKGLLRLELSIMDGNMVKGKIRLVCYGRMHQDALKGIEQDPDNDEDILSLADDQSLESIQSLTQRRQSHHSVPALSLHTPTPITTTIDFLGLRIVDFRCNITNYGLDDKGTITAVLNCGDYSFLTLPKALVVHKQLRTSFQWLFPHTMIYHWIVRGSPFVKVSVYYNTTVLIGVMCISLREWLIQSKDALGIMSIVRSIVNEENMNIGKCVVSGILSAEYPAEGEIYENTQLRAAEATMNNNNVDGKGEMLHRRKPNRDLTFPIEWRVLRIDVMDMINIDWITKVANAMNGTNTLGKVMKSAKSAFKKALNNGNDPEKTNTLQYPSIFVPLETEKITIEIRTIDDCKSSGLSNDPQAAVPGILSIDILKKFRTISRDNLTWKWLFLSAEDFQDIDNHLIEIEIFYGSESLILLAITLKDLIAQPRSYQGYGEYCCYLNPKEKSFGKLKISYFLHNATIPDVVSLTTQAKEMLQRVDELTAQSPIMKIKCNLITCEEISLFFPHCYVYLMIDKASWTSDKSNNDHGMVLFPMTKIQKDYVFINDRSIVFLRVHDSTSNKIVGTVCLSFHDLVSATYDTTLHMTIIQKELMIGFNRMGRLSMTLERYYDLDYIPPKEEISLLQEEEEDDEGIDADLPGLSDGSEVIIVAVDVWDLVRIASPNIRNSPMINVEYLGLKFCSDSIPFADSAASWEQFFWKLNCRSSGILKLRVLSSSLIIGTVNVSMKEVYTLMPDPASREINIERSIKKGDRITGMIRLRCICPVAAVKPKVHAMLKKTKGSILTTNSILSSQSAAFVPLRSALQSRVLRQNLALFQTLRVGDPAMRVAGYAHDDQSTIQSQAHTTESNEFESKGLPEPSESLAEDSFHTNSYFSSTTGDENATFLMPGQPSTNEASQSYASTGVSYQSSQVTSNERPRTSRGPSVLSSSQPNLSENSAVNSSSLLDTSVASPVTKGTSSSTKKTSKYSSYLASISEASAAYTFKYSRDSPGKRLPPTPPPEEDSITSNSYSGSDSYSYSRDDSYESSRYDASSNSYYTSQTGPGDDGSSSVSGSMTSRSDYSTNDVSSQDSSYSLSHASTYDSPSVSRYTSDYSGSDSFYDNQDRSVKSSTYTEHTSSCPNLDEFTANPDKGMFTRSVTFAADPVPSESEKANKPLLMQTLDDETDASVNSETFALPVPQQSLHVLHTSQPARSYIQFEIQNLIYLDSNRADKNHVLLHTATVFVSNLLERVVDSLVAEQVGMDFYGGQEPSSSKKFAINIPNTFTKGLVVDENWKISYLLGLQTVQTVLLAAGTNALKRITAFTHTHNVPINTAITTIATTIPDRGPQFTKRQGIMMLSSGQGQVRDNGNEPQTIEKPKPYIMEKLIKRGKAEFFIPLKARITIQDILGIDISLIDHGVMPTRPYITACKPYGNWAAETNPVTIDLSLEDAHNQVYLLNYFNLHVRYKWETFILKQGQVVVFDLHDARSGLLFGKCTLPYEECFNQHTLANVANKDVDYLTQLFESVIPLVFTLADEFGGGQLAGIIRVSLDLSINIFTASQKSTSYWDMHRMEHWCTFPLPPISYGMIRQKYRDIAYDYDNQQLIHPSLYGFTIRYRGNQQDESRFKHPIFTSYSLVKRILPLTTKGTAKKKSAPTRKGSSGPGKTTPSVNPFRYDPNAKERGQCPVCSDGLPGCPRCFMMPVRSTDHNPFSPAEFGFSGGDDRLQRLRLDKKLLELHVQKTKQLSNLEHHKEELREYTAAALDKVTARRGKAATQDEEDEEDDIDTESAVDVMSSLSELHKEDVVQRLRKQIEDQYEVAKAKLLKDAENDELDDDTNTLEAQLRRERKAANFHTNLTSYRSIRDYRLLAMPHFNIYVKFLPTGYIKRFTVNNNCTIAHLYHMFNSHSSYGNSTASMILLPTNVGVFELHPYLSFISDAMRADNRGHDTLSAYHLNEPFASYVLIFIANYPQVKSTTMKSYVNNPDNQIPMMLSDFFSKNTDYALPVLPTYHGIDKLPAATKENPNNHLISQDKVQQYLVRIMSYAYTLQQKDLLAFYKQLGRQYQESRHLSQQIQKNEEVARLNYLSKQQYQLELRNEAQLRKFGGNTRKLEHARKELETREQSKRRVIRVDEMNDLEEEEGNDYNGDAQSRGRRNSDEISLSEVMFLEDANEERDVLKEITIEMMASPEDGDEVESVMTDEDDWWESSSSKDFENNENDDRSIGSAQHGNEDDMSRESNHVTSQPVVPTGSTLQTITALRQRRSSQSTTSQSQADEEYVDDVNQSYTSRSQGSMLSAMTSSTFNSQQTGYTSMSSSSQLASSLPPSIGTAYSSYFTAVSTSYDQEGGSEKTVPTSRSLPISYPSDVRQPFVSTDDALSLYSRHKRHNEESNSTAGSGVYSHTHSMYSAVSSGPSLTSHTTPSSAASFASSTSLPSHDLSHSTGGLFTYRSQQSLQTRSLGSLPSLSHASVMSQNTGSVIQSLYSDHHHSLSSASSYHSASTYDSATANSYGDGSDDDGRSSRHTASVVSRDEDDVSQLTLPEEINSAIGSYQDSPSIAASLAGSAVTPSVHSQQRTAAITVTTTAAAVVYPSDSNGSKSSGGSHSSRRRRTREESSEESVSSATSGVYSSSCTPSSTTPMTSSQSYYSAQSPHSSQYTSQYSSQYSPHSHPTASTTLSYSTAPSTTSYDTSTNSGSSNSNSRSYYSNDSVTRSVTTGAHSNSHQSSASTTTSTANRTHPSTGYSADLSDSHTGTVFPTHPVNHPLRAHRGYGYLEDTTSSTHSSSSTPSIASTASHSNPSGSMTRPAWVSDDQYHHTIDTITEQDDESSSAISSFHTRNTRQRMMMNHTVPPLYASNSVSSLSAITDFFDLDSQASYLSGNSDEHSTSSSHQS